GSGFICRSLCPIICCAATMKCAGALAGNHMATASCACAVIPGRSHRERTRNPEAITSGFRVCAEEAHPGMTARRFEEFSRMHLQFQTVDVFTAERFSGNPLAVVLNAEGLSSEQMQAIAAEFNLAETTFVLPPKDAANTAHVRIFTPRGEMPFAGHPNVGTAFVLARAGAVYGQPIAGDRVTFEENAGLVPIALLKDGATVVGVPRRSPK